MRKGGAVQRSSARGGGKSMDRGVSEFYRMRATGWGLGLCGIGTEKREVEAVKSRAHSFFRRGKCLK